MKLTPGQLRSAIDKLRPLLHERECAVCEMTAGWQIQDALFELREFQGGDLGVSVPLLPLLPVTCNACGHTLTFNAVTLGLLSANGEVTQ